MTAIEKLHDGIDREAILRHLNLNMRDPAAQALVLVCERYSLDPILKHAVLIQGRMYVTRDGLLHVAHASGQLDGIEVLEQGETDTHYTAKVAVYRKDMGRPFTYIGRFPKSQRMAKEYGPEMAVKCGEVMALRRAFDVALCAAEERWDEEAQRDLTVQAPPAPQRAIEAPTQVMDAEVISMPADQPEKATKGQFGAINGYLQSRFEFTDDERAQKLDFLAWLLSLPALASSKDLTQDQARTVLTVLSACKEPQELLANWQASRLLANTN